MRWRIPDGTLDGDTYLLMHSEDTGSHSLLRRIATFLVLIGHPRGQEFAERTSAAFQAERDNSLADLELPDELLDVLMEEVKAITPVGYRYADGYVWASEAGWIGWVRTTA